MWKRVRRLVKASGYAAVGALATLLVQQRRGAGDRARSSRSPRRRRRPRGEVGTFAPAVRDAISKSRDAAVRLGHERIDTPHLLLGLLASEGHQAADVLRHMGADPEALKLAATEAAGPTSGRSPTANVPLTKPAESVLKRTYLEAADLGSPTIDTGHLLLSLLHASGPAAQALARFDVTHARVRAALDDLSGA